MDTVDAYSETATISNDPSGANTDVVQQMMEGLPAELSDDQRDKVRDFLVAKYTKYTISAFTPQSQSITAL